MTTETTTTNQLPPCPLPDCEGGEHHYHDVDVYAVNGAHDCATDARFGFRCYGPHRPGIPQWQPIEHDQIRAGMRIRATFHRGDRATVHVGVAHRRVGADWVTEKRWSLTGWGYPTTYEVDPATIPDPDAELIEKIGKAIHDADEPGFEWGEDGSENVYRKLARAALTVIRTHDEAGDGR